MKFAADRPYCDPEKAAHKLIEIANSVESAQDGRIFIELINWPFLREHGGSAAEYKAGLQVAIARGWLVLLNRSDLLTRAEGNSTAGHVSVAAHVSGVAPCATGPLMAA